ncbi:MAG TPA: hypothetical protein ENI23_03950, partial [bacterium]|nr:hypothetical protein [bacterium]
TDQIVIEHLFLEVAKDRGFYSEELVEDIANGKHLPEIQDKYDIPDDVVSIFKTTHEVAPEQHVRVQAAFQENVDSAVSKTINLANSATKEDIKKVYTLAYRLGCKGITVFRDGSKDPALQVGTSSEKKEEGGGSEAVTVQRGTLEPRDRQTMTKGTTTKVNTEQGSLFVTINEDDEGIVEVFLNVGKSGSFTAGYTEAIGRLISTALRSGIETKHIIEQLKGIRTSTPTMNKGMIIYSVPDAVAKVLENHLNKEKEQVKMFAEEIKLEPIPDDESKVEEESKTVLERIEVEVEEKQEGAAPSTKSKAQNKEETTIIKEPNHIDGKHYTKQNTVGDLLECPDCGGDLEYAEGCTLCRSCGYSKCG